MSPATTSSSCPDNQIVLVRRGAVDHAQWEALMTHLRTCAECRFTWLAAQSFAGSGAVQPGDERLVGDAVEGALGLGRFSRRRDGRGRRLALAVAAAMVFGATMAVAGMAIQRRATTAAREETAAAATHGARQPARARDARSAAPTTEQAAQVPTLDEPAPAPSSPPDAPESVAVRPSAAASAAPGARVAGTRMAGRAGGRLASGSPQAALFERATVARRFGRVAEAVANFRRLQREFPDTPEAIVSLVSLGELLAESSAPGDDALASFDRYLDKAPSGPLAPEALAGKARVLARLGRSDEAQRIREELQRAYPHWPSSVASPPGRPSGGGR